MLDVKTSHFIQAVIAFQISGYILSGISKLLISPNGLEWIFENDLSLLFHNASLRGWLSNLPTEMNESVSVFLNSYGKLLNILTFFMEIGMIFFFLNSKLARFFLIGILLFHIGTMAISGVFFWVWIILDVAIILCFLQFNQFLKEHLFGKKSLYKSFLLIGLSILLVKPPIYAWFDSPYQWFVKVMVEDIDGKKYVMHKHDFGLYSPYFTQGYLKYTINSKLLSPSGYATHKYKEFQALKKSKITSLDSVKNKFGKNYYDADKDSFVTQFLTNYYQHINNLLKKPCTYNYPGSLKQLYMYQPLQEKYRFNKKVVRVSLVLNKYYFTNDSYKLIDKTTYKSIDI